MNLTTTLPLRAYLLTFAVFVKEIIYVQNGFSVGSSFIHSHETNTNSHKKGKHFTNVTFFDNRPESFTPFSETRLRDKEL